MIPIDSIEIPDRFVALCDAWYDGSGSMMYAVSSTGNLIIGTIRPLRCETREQWYYTLWRDLAIEVYHARRAAFGDQGECAAVADLCDFEEWIDKQVDQLCESYGLEDWEG